MPTTSASRLSAVRFSWNARVSWPTVAACSLAAATRRPAGSRVRTRSSSAGRRDEVDAGDVIAEPEQGLRGADVHQRHRLERSRLLGVGGVREARDLERGRTPLHREAQRRADAQAVACGEGRADDHGPRVDEHAREAGLGERSAGQVRAERPVGQRVEAEDAQRLAVEVDGDRVAFDDRSAGAHAGLDPDPTEHVLGHAAGSPEHLVGRAARHGLRAALEGAARARVGEVDRDHDGHSERDPEHHQAGVQGPSRQVSQPGQQERAAQSGSRVRPARLRDGHQVARFDREARDRRPRRSRDCASRAAASARARG